MSGLLRSEIARTVLHVIKDPRIQGVSITHVHVTKDLRLARVYYSVLGDTERQAEALEGLSSAKGLIKRELSRNLNLRYVPEIEIFFDETLEYADHIEQLLKKVGDAEPGALE